MFPAITFMPVVEQCQNNNGFLCKYPLVNFKQESNVPVLMGMNSGEGGLFAASEFFFYFFFSKRVKYFNDYSSSV